jgi:SpoIID/LytB domain protein
MEIATDAPLAELAQIAGLKSIEVLANNQAGRPIRIRLVDSRGATLDLRAEDFRRAVNYAREGEATPRDRLNSSNFRAQLNGATISFTGAGLGHGVGMCQYGAESMAQRGVTAPQILRTYYPDATVRKAY